MTNLKALLPHARTKRQREVLKTLISNPTLSQNELAAKVGMNERNLRKTIKRIKDYAAIQGHAPEHDMYHTTPDTHVVKGVSTNYDADGNIRQQWVKTDLAKSAQNAAAVAMIEELKADLPTITPSEFTGYAADDLCAVYPLGDPHIGMKDLINDGWDLTTAEAVFLGVFDRLVKSAPSCREAVIVNLGDYFHYDNAVLKQTMRSGHHLDTDGHYIDMVRTGIKIMKQMIQSALEHHDTVHIINVIGNHDDSGAMGLSVFLEQMYMDEPRVTVDVTRSEFNYYIFGNTLLGAHHGHNCKPAELPLVMAVDRAKEWAECDNRYWLTGHVHHDSKKDFNGCSVESFRTLASQDAWATSRGYRSQRDSKCLVIHRQHGEIERHIINISQLEDHK